MKLTVNREAPISPPIKNVVLELTAQEAADLATIIGATKGGTKFGDKTTSVPYEQLSGVEGVAKLRRNVNPEPFNRFGGARLSPFFT